mgnify:CR=1 FL=1
MEQHINEHQPEESSVNLVKIISVLRLNWKWFALSVLVALFIAIIYLRYSTPEYMVNATILVQDDKKGGSTPDADMLQSLGLGGKSNVDNEVKIFKSRTIMEKVVNDLQLNVQYFTEGRIKTVERYQTKSFDLFFVPLFVDSLKRVKEFTFRQTDNNTFLLVNGKKEIRGKWGDTILLPFGKAIFKPTYASGTEMDELYTIVVNNPENTVARFMNALSVGVSNKQVSAIDLALQTSVPKKGEDILNKLIDVYLQFNVNDKNRIADSTMRFIDERLVLVGQELTGIEKEIESFKESSGLTDLSAQSQQLITSTSDYVKQLTEQQVQLSVVESLQKYLAQNEKNTVPSSLVMQDPTFTALVNNYNTLQQEREKMLLSSTENNPLVKNLDQRITNVRSDLRNSLASVKRGIEASISQLSRQTGTLTSQMREVPAKERIFLEKSRQQSIKQELYLFLLKKREETAIAKSSTIANARIIDSAKSSNVPFKPDRGSVYLSALLIGLFAPVVVLFSKEMLNTKVRSKEDITGRTQIPIIGEISHEDSKEPVVVKQGSRSQIAEQFRTLRTNLQFMLTNAEDKVILLTSSMSGEGKSFVAINLASSLALSGKKVVLLEMDLRKPKVSQNLQIDNSIGFSTFIIGQATLEKVIVPSGVQENLYVIPSGPIPPNPAELLMLPMVQDFFQILRNNFEYILVDTAPVGLVTDAQLLSKFSDVNVYLVRQGYTFKEQINIPNNLVKQQKMSRVSIVVNDIAQGAGYGYGYGGYGYGGYAYGGYSNGYFENDEKRKKNSLKNLFRQ